MNCINEDMIGYTLSHRWLLLWYDESRQHYVSAEKSGSSEPLIQDCIDFSEQNAVLETMLMPG